MYLLLFGVCLFVRGWSYSVCWSACACGGCWERQWNEVVLDWRGWNKHLEVTQVDSGLVCSLYQWGPGPWTLGVYLSSWGTMAHYSPPIMPHRAPFLCLNWGAVCTPMNYSIYLLRRSEVCLEKLLQTAKCPHVYSLICANSGVFFLNQLRFFFLLINLVLDLLISCLISQQTERALQSLCIHTSVHCGWYLPLSLSLSLFTLPFYGTYGATAWPRLAALVFGQLESVYMSVMPHAKPCQERWV